MPTPVVTTCPLSQIAPGDSFDITPATDPGYVVANPTGTGWAVPPGKVACVRVADGVCVEIDATASVSPRDYKLVAQS